MRVTRFIILHERTSEVDLVEAVEDGLYGTREEAQESLELFDPMAIPKHRVVKIQIETVKGP